MTSRKVKLSSLGCLFALLFMTLFLGGCFDSWNPFSPITRLWEKSAENAVVEQETPEPEPADAREEEVDVPADEAAPEGPARSDETRTEGEEESPAAADGDEVPGDLRGVRWLHTDVSGWRETGNLRSVRVSGGTITLDYDKARSWPGRNHSGAFVNANPWIFVFHDGAWYAATWEWLRYGQTSKSARSVAGDHIKKPPLQGFRPRSGERYGFMVSGLARDKTRNVEERTNVLMYRWP